MTSAASVTTKTETSDLPEDTDHTVFHGAWSDVGAVFFGPDDEGQSVPQADWQIRTEIVRTNEQTITMAIEKRVVESGDRVSRCEIQLYSKAELAFFIDLLGSSLRHFPQVPLATERDAQTHEWRNAETVRYRIGTLVTEAES